jgi:Ca-activated chloride channel family protein
MSFYSPHAFWLLVIPFVLAGLDFVRRRRAAQVPHPKILRAVADSSGLALADRAPARPRSVRFRWRLWLGLVLAVTAVARPQWGRIDEPVFDQAREILIAIDLSRSMLADDVKPNRLERAKLLITSLLERLEGERVGLIVFAGTAFLQSPLSADYEILREFLPELNPEYLPEGGSNYTALIDNALTAFGPEKSADRFLIVLSDGESTTEDWQQRVPTLVEKGVRVLSLGIGTTAGAMIPDSTGGFVKDDRGAVVLSRLGTSTLQELAQKTGGVYTDASTWVDLAQIVTTTVDQGKKGDFTDIQQVRLAERYQWALAPAVLLLLWSFWREFPVHPKARDLRLAPAGSTAAHPRSSASVPATVAVLLLAALLSPRTSQAQEAEVVKTLAAPLSTLVAQLSARDNLEARDYDELARTTLTFGERLQGSSQPVPQGPVIDGIAAVDAGAALNSTFTEWAPLRKKLEELLENKDQPQQDPQKQEQDQQQQGEQSDDQKQENQEGGKQSNDQKQKSDGEQKQSKGEAKGDDEQNPENNPQQQGESAFGDMEKPAPPPPPPPQGDTQKVGGNPDKEQKESEAPELAVPLQKLDQIRNQDSPAKLHQLMQDPNAKGKGQKGRDW